MVSGEYPPSRCIASAPNVDGVTTFHNFADQCRQDVRTLWIELVAGTVHVGRAQDNGGHALGEALAIHATQDLGESLRPAHEVILLVRFAVEHLVFSQWSLTHGRIARGTGQPLEFLDTRSI